MRHKLIETTTQLDTTIKLLFDGGAWANMTFTRMKNEWTNVAIVSDWGAWDYGWSDSGIRSHGNIYGFMGVSPDLCYLRTKFIGAEKELFDAKKTCTEIRKVIRKEAPWIKDKEFHEQLMGYVSDLEGIETDNEFYESIDGNLREFLGDDYWQYLVYSRHPRTRFFFDKIFPRFIPQIKKLHKQSVINSGYER